MKKLLNILKKSALPFFIIVVISLTLSLALAEKVVRFASPQLTYSQAKAVSLPVYDKSEKLPFKLLSNLNVMHVGNTHEFSYRITTNTKGYRMDEFQTEKDSNTYRILMLGDSLTFGYGVENNQSIPHILGENLNKYLADNNIKGKTIQVINAGFMDGKSPDAYYLYLKEEGFKLNPDLVIVSYFVNNDVSDLDDSRWEKTDADGLPTKITSATAYIDPPYFRLKREFQDWKLTIPILRNSHLWILFSTALESKSPNTVNFLKNFLGTKPLPTIKDAENEDCIYEGRCNERMQKASERFYSLAKATAKVASENGKPLIVAMLPSNPQVKNEASYVKSKLSSKELTLENVEEVVKNAQPQKSWNELFTQLDIPVINPLAYVTKSDPQNLYFPKDGHPTKEGYEVLSSAIFDFLIEDWKISEKLTGQ